MKSFYITKGFQIVGGLKGPESYWTASSEVKSLNCNGCGEGGWKGNLVPDTVWGLSVTACCNIHDWMYGEGVTEDDRDFADLVFLNNMLNTVDTAEKTPHLRWLFAPLRFVLAAARRHRVWIYYGAVRYVGQTAFDGATIAEG
tara:strand:+ start:42201 stop:42629 length:429 start_codon:yes stop_codon:yes gene_type:complete